MQILSADQIPQAIKLLKRGGVIVYPTETCYAIGCDATNPKAVQRVYEIKDRPQGKGFTLGLPANDPYGQNIATWSEPLKKLADQHWPGPLNVTLPVKPKSKLAPACLVDQTVAFRRSSHPIARALADGLGAPLVSTSANVSGEPESYDVPTLVERYKTRKFQPDAAVDFGPLPRHKPSTLVALNEVGEVIILRQGDIKIEGSGPSLPSEKWWNVKQNNPGINVSEGLL